MEDTDNKDNKIAGGGVSKAGSAKSYKGGIILYSII